ncbi:MAG TPA: amidohydrolase family protein [Verrucomicrobiae bacterium]|nr:amidohydrolase family protein [Verrucomicrobiae bacterium]
MIVRARNILPVCSPPVANGAVAVSGNRITAVGDWKDISRQAADGDDVVDLGDVVLMPGLINAHCHLDYTDMAGFWSPPKRFTDWIPQMLAAKAEWSYADYARSWLNGAQMLLRTGTTTVADIEAAPELLPDVWNSCPLRVHSFLEMTGVRSRREPHEIIAEALHRVETLSHPRCRTWLSPHAPYSTSPDLLRLCAQTAREKQLLVAIHVAESEQEFDMFTHARGHMHLWLQRNGRSDADCGLGSPVRHLERTGLLGENVLAIHANCLAPGDAEALAQHRVHVVHCPRSHDYFQHPPFPRKALADAGVNLCLGTDSLSTVRKKGKEAPELSLFLEMPVLQANDKTVSARTIVEMATVNGARALGLAGQLGQLSPHALADLIAIPFRGKVADIDDAVVHHASTVSVSMIDGKWAIAP